MLTTCQRVRETFLFCESGVRSKFFFAKGKAAPIITDMSGILLK